MSAHVPTTCLQPAPKKKRGKKSKGMNPEGFEPPTFGSGIRRAAVAPWVRGASGSGFASPLRRAVATKTKGCAPPLGIEPRTCRLTADRSANGALEALIPRPGIEPGSGG